MTGNNNAGRQLLSLGELQADHYYMCSFLSIATHNAYLILKDLSEKYAEVGGWDPEQLEEGKLFESKLVHALKQKNQKGFRVSEKAEITQNLLRRMPAFEKIALCPPKKGEKQKGEVEIPELDITKVFDSLRNALELLNFLRNKYAHYQQEEKRKLVIPEINLIFEEACKELIERFPHYDESNTQHLNDEKIRLLNEDNTATIIGEIFLTCQFLDRGTAFAFLRNIEGFRPSDDLAQRAKLDAFTIFCSRLPQPKLGSSDIELDMLNELRRVPKELYNRLSDADKKLFKNTVEELPGDEDELIEDEIEGGNIIDMRRHQDRFPYFALRYFEKMEAPFKRLRFQLKLGRLRHLDQNYNKEIGSVTRKRKILEDIHTFALLDEVNEERILSDTKHKHWTDYDEKLTRKTLHPALDQFSPHYHIVANKIAFKFVDKSEHRTYPLPNLNVLKKDENAFLQVDLDMPDAIMSTYELGNFYLYHYLHSEGKIDQDIETFLENYINNFRAFCQKVNDGEILPVTSVPFQKKQAERRKGAYSNKQLKKLRTSQEKFEELVAEHG